MTSKITMFANEKYMLIDIKKSEDLSENPQSVAEAPINDETTPQEHYQDVASLLTTDILNAVSYKENAFVKSMEL